MSHEIRRKIINVLVDDGATDKDDLIEQVADGLQVDSEDVRSVLEQGIEDGFLTKTDSKISLGR